MCSACRRRAHLALVASVRRVVCEREVDGGGAEAGAHKAARLGVLVVRLLRMCVHAMHACVPARQPSLRLRRRCLLCMWAGCQTPPASGMQPSLPPLRCLLRCLPLPRAAHLWLGEEGVDRG